MKFTPAIRVLFLGLTALSLTFCNTSKDSGGGGGGGDQADQDCVANPYGNQQQQTQGTQGTYPQGAQTAGAQQSSFGLATFASFSSSLATCTQFCSSTTTVAGSLPSCSDEAALRASLSTNSAALVTCLSSNPTALASAFAWAASDSLATNSVGTNNFNNAATTTTPTTQGGFGSSNASTGYPCP